MIAKEMLEAFHRVADNPKQKAYYRWLMENCEEMKADSVPKIELKFIPRIRGCFYNAQMIAVTYEKAEYYEGWGVCGLSIPLEHAWVVIGGRVLDVTWDEGVEYCGMHIPNEFIVDEEVETGRALIPQYYKHCLDTKDKNGIP